jgi:hypothetical protein
MYEEGLVAVGAVVGWWRDHSNRQRRRRHDGWRVGKQTTQHIHTYTYTYTDTLASL